ncbi:YciI family protein [Desulfosediminicola ganghwensis]|uniref:YciI family protein n=1 Tax=Desulfosediminicola ganghwensis TaxID=2569540 RepID=UPI0010AD5463|nr:YciI family protein [Desulfosediminicola ganghwensis]
MSERSETSIFSISLRLISSRYFALEQISCSPGTPHVDSISNSPTSKTRSPLDNELKKFVAILSSKSKDRFSEGLLQEHIDHLQKLYDEKVLELCGPFTDDDSAIQIIRAADLTAAERIIYQDPFVKHNYYSTVRIKELIEANPANNWLVSHPQTEQKR